MLQPTGANGIRLCTGVRYLKIKITSLNRESPLQLNTGVRQQHRLLEMPPLVLRSYSIDDDLGEADRGAIEVSITLADERRRWCYFMTPSAFAACGDFVSGTNVRVHRGEPHMIVVSEASRTIIEAVLRTLEAEGELERRTLPLEVSH